MIGETMEQSYAVVDTATNNVVNVVVWDGERDYQPGKGLTLVPMPFEDEDGVRRYTGGIGWTLRDGEFVDNRPVEDDLEG